MSESPKWFWLTIILIAVALVYVLSPVLMPFLTAALIAYIGNPIVAALSDYKIPRTLGVVLLFLLGICVILLLLFLLIPMLERQITWLVTKFPDIITWVQQKILPFLDKHFQLGEQISLENLKTLLSRHWQQAGGIAATVVQTLSSSGLAIITWSVNVLLTAVVSFYLLRDWQTVWDSSRQLIPRDAEPVVLDLVSQCNEVLGAFFRGQLLVMLSLGTIYSIGLAIVDLNLALLIGMISGLVSIVPYLGFIVGIGAATIAALLQFGDSWHLLLVWLVFAIGQMAESMLLTPLLVGDRIGLHPVAVIFAVLAGGQLFGFVGVLLALPTAAVLKVFLGYAKGQYQASGMYQAKNRPVM